MTLLTASLSQGHVVLGLGFLGTVFVIFAFMHWRLRTGWQMDSGPFKPRPLMRPLVISLMFTGAPGMVTTGAFAAIVVIIRLFGGSHSHVTVIAVLSLFLVAVAASVYMATQFWRPSQRRVPDWLR